MADFPAAAVDRLGKYNGERYNAQTNPFGLAIGGHRQNYPPSLNETASVAAYIAAAAGEVGSAADQTADDRRQTGEDRAAAANSAAQAAKFDPANFVRRDGTQGMTGGALRLAPSTAQNASLIVPAGMATPAGAALVDGAIWGDGNTLITRLGGVTRTIHDTANTPAPSNAELDAGTDTNRKAFSVANIIRAVAARFVRFDIGQQLTPAQQLQARFNIDAASRKQVVASFNGNGSSLFYLTPEMIIDNPVLDYVVSSGNVVVSARAGTASGYIGGGADYLINTFQVLGNSNTASFQQARSTLALGAEVMSGTLTVSPIGLRSRASGIVNSNGNRLDVMGTSTVTGDRLMIVNFDGSPLPNGASIIFYGSKRT